MGLWHRDIRRIAPLTGALVAFAILGGPAAPGAEARGCGGSADLKPKELAPGEARDAILCLLNVERRQHGLSLLEDNKKLQKAAQNHTDRMDGSGCFDHQCPGEPALDNRLGVVDYLVGGLTRWMVGENIAWGYDEDGTPRAIVDLWMHSPPHRATLLTPDFKDVGIGFAAGTPKDGKDPGGIYTTDFGLRRG